MNKTKRKIAVLTVLLALPFVCLGEESCEGDLDCYIKGRAKGIEIGISEGKALGIEIGKQVGFKEGRENCPSGLIADPTKSGNIISPGTLGGGTTTSETVGDAILRMQAMLQPSHLLTVDEDALIGQLESQLQIIKDR